MNPYQQYEVRLTIQEMEDMIGVCVGKPHLFDAMNRLKIILQQIQSKDKL